MAWSKGVLVATLFFGAVDSITFPAIAALKSNNAAAEEQGLLQGALLGAQSLAKGFAALGYAGLYSLGGAGCAAAEDGA